jgi:hypothetical protein
MIAINIIFDGPPGPDGPRFVEVEDDQGNSIRIGDWAEYQPEGYEHEGFWKLRISLAELKALDATTELPEEC